MFLLVQLKENILVNQSKTKQQILALFSFLSLQLHFPELQSSGLVDLVGNVRSRSSLFGYVRRMENMNGLNSFAFSAKNRHGMPLSPLSLLMDSPSSDSNDSSPFEPKGNIKSMEGLNGHQRCSSESFIFEDQPSWLDDLLNDSEIFVHRGHRRAASDSYAYLGAAATTFNTREESKFLNAYIETDENNNQETEELAVEKNREESSSQTLEGSSSKANGSQAKQSASKSDTKRAKQHNAHRSRVRKLQYISHLERTVQMLQIEGSEVSAELQFIEQQNVILSMENRALKQRLESISQEQIIKHWEQEMLEREIGRLQTLHHIQKQQQQQLQNQQPQHPKQRRSRSKDFDQVNNCAMKNKEPISSNDSVSASIRA